MLQFGDNGEIISNDQYKEILTLQQMLLVAGIPHEIVRSMDGWQIFYPNKKDRVMDAIEFSGSYGDSKDLLEIMGLLTPEEKEIDCVCGYLTAADVFERIKRHWDSVGRETSEVSK